MNNKHEIRILPRSVIDRIKAGEVIQRTASAIKELVENSLDAGATKIVVTLAHDCHSSISVSDNGCGIQPSCLKRAVQRHATSKLHVATDLDQLQSFGFRGEALASVVSAAKNVQITSRTPDNQVAHTQSFTAKDTEQVATGKPTPCARPEGTTIQISNLFFDMPIRRKLRPADEYKAALQVVQHYSIEYAGAGVGMICQRRSNDSKKGSQVDLNTCGLVHRSSNPAKDDKRWKENTTKTVASSIYGSHLLPQLISIDSEFLAPAYNNKESDSFVSADASLDDCRKLEAVVARKCPEEMYKWWGLCTKPASGLTRPGSRGTSFFVFVNHRWIQWPLLKRRIDDLWARYGLKGTPFVYLSFQVPPRFVDVNIHPTKKLVALLHEYELLDTVLKRLQKVWEQEERSFPEVIGTVPNASPQIITPTTNRQTSKRAVPSVPSNQDSSSKPSATSAKRVRTSSAVSRGAIEAFVQPSPSQSFLTPGPTTHKPHCPLAQSNATEADLTQPGVFAILARKCQCRMIVSLETGLKMAVRLPTQAWIRRPSRVCMTPCSYTSVTQLRRRIESKRLSSKDQARLRNSSWVGVVSPHRSLIQCEDELVLLNHHECARQLFYQLALYQFGSGKETDNGGEVKNTRVAHLPGHGLDVAQLIANGALQQLDSEDVSETDKALAEQATGCLWDHAEMLAEYFKIILSLDNEQSTDRTAPRRVMLLGLPILLEGYEPCAEGLPLFLLRLATEVSWTEEKPCFHDISRELGSFYAQLPTNTDQLISTVQHVIFPAVTSLLTPQQSLRDEANNGFATMINLDSLYRVFERC